MSQSVWSRAFARVCLRASGLRDDGAAALRRGRGLLAGALFLTIASTAHAIIGPITMTGPTVTTPGGTLAAAGTTVPVNVAFTAGVSGSGIIADTVDGMTLYELIGGVRTQLAVIGFTERFRPPDYDIPYDDGRSGTLVGNLGPGTHEIFLTAQSYQGQSLDSAHVFVTITLNSPPNVTLTAPANGTTVQLASGTYTMTVTGTASPTYGTLQKTEVWVDGSLNSTLTGAAAATVSTTVGLAGGAHTIALKAYNNTGISAQTPLANVFVNRPPSVTMTAPVSRTAPGNTYAFTGTPVPISVTGTASDPDAGDSVTTELLVNSASVQTFTGSAATAVNAVYNASARGNYTIQLRSTDAHGAVSVTPGVTVALLAPPTITLTSPGNAAIFQTTAGASVSVPVSGTGVNNDIGIVSVVLLVDGVSSGTANSSNFSGSFSASPGSHVLQLETNDADGGHMLSNSVTIVVNQPPTVNMSAPLASNVVAWPGSAFAISINGGAADPDSGDSITKTEVLVNAVAQPPLASSNLTSIATSYLVTGPGTYQIQLRSTDSRGAVGYSNTATVVVDALPGVTMSAPANGAIVQASSVGATVTVPVSGSASDSDGTITSMQLLVDGQVVSTIAGGTVSTSYTVAPGSHTFQLKATDSQGMSGFAPVATVIVNQPPSVSMTAPTAATQAWAGVGVPIAIKGSSSDPDSGDGISKVEVLVNSVAQAPLTGAAATTVNTTYTAAAAGNYLIQLRATDSRGGVTVSNGATVVLDLPPTASMTAPANSAVFQTTLGAKYAVPVAGSATDSDGSVANIQLLVDGASVTTTPGASVSTTYQVTPGAHTFQLKSTDDRGVSTSSALANVYVNQPPAASLATPGTLLANWVGTNVAIPVTGSASDPDSGDSIAKTEVLVNTQSVQTLTGAAATAVNTSYSATAPGIYLVQLRVTDSHGGTATTAGFSFDVNAAPGVTLAAPANGSSFLTDPQGQVAVTITGAATDSDGSVANVKILVDGAVVNTITGASVSTSQPMGLGTHTVQLLAFDNQGNSTRSAVSTITVTGSLALMTLPQANTAKAGTIQGTEDVAAGKATYSTSIPMPPGVNGMVPSVSLSYGGGTDIGNLGVGWTMSATSSIERCPPTIVQDGRMDTVRFTTKDRLCLDGKRLQLAVPPQGSDSFDTAYWAPYAEYRTEIESFVRVKHSGTGFQVYTKDGRIHLYGDTADTTDTDTGATASQVFSTTRTNAPTGTAIHTWMLRDTQDRFGNAIDYTYVKDTGTGEFVLRYIRYGANANAGQAHFAKVQFDYTPRNDANVDYIAGGRADKNLRLSKITTLTDTQADGTGGSQALQYTLNYDYSTTSGRSRVTSLVECGATTTDCLPPTTFKYGDPNASVTPGFTVDRGTWAGPPLEDAVGVGNCAITEPQVPNDCNYPVSAMFLTADFNGDGLSDMITKYPSFAPGVTPLSIYVNNGTGFNAPIALPLHGVTIDSSYFVLLTGDFDGDGQTDIILAHTGATSGVLASKYDFGRLSDWKICYSRLRQGNGFQCQEWAAPATMLAIDPAELLSARVYDFDGDGRDDIFIAGGLRHSITGGTAWITHDNSMLCTSTGAAFSCNRSGPIIDMSAGVVADGYVSSPAPATSLPVDMDGDGRLDVASWTEPYPSPCVKGDGPCNGGFSYDQTGAWIRSYTSEGAASVQQAWAYYDLPEATGTSVLNAILGGMVVGDLNGDGYSDLFIYEQVNPTIGPRWRVCHGMGNSKVSTCIPASFPDAPGVFPQLAGDFDGDGQTKIFVRPLLQGTGIYPKMCTVRGTTDAQTATCGANWTIQAPTTPNFGYFDFSDNVESTHAGYMDLSGNGTTDWVLYTPGGPDPARSGAQKPGQWHVYSPQNRAKAGEALDRMVQVVDGLGKKTQFVYALPGDASVYSADAIGPDGVVMPVSYPEMRVPRMGTLVKSILVDNGQGGSIEHDYHYAGASRDMAGRGALGFAEVDVTDRTSTTTAIKRTQWFSKTWPTIGQTVASATVYSDASAGTSKTTDKVSTTYATGIIALFNSGSATSQVGWTANSVNTVCAYANRTTESRWDIDAANSLIATTVATTDGVDAWCNPTSTTVTTSGDGNSYVTTTGTKFNNDLSNWFIGQALGTATTKTRAGACAVRRASSTFDPARGVATSQTVEPPSSDPGYVASTCANADADSLYTLKTTFSRTNADNSANLFGLTRLVTQSWLDPLSSSTVSRTKVQVTAFEAKGRFAQTVQNALAQQQTMLYDSRYGTARQLTDLNGLVTTESTDAFGHETITLDPEGNETRSLLRQCDGSCPAGATSIAVKDTLHLNSPGNYTRIASPSLVYNDDGGRALRTTTWGFSGRPIFADQRYDVRGRQSQIDHPHFSGDAAVLATSILYDDLDRVRQRIVYGETNDSRISKTDFAGRVTTSTNAANQKKIATNDALGLLVQSTDAASNSTSYGHEPFGDLNRVTDPLLNVVAMAYDRLGRRASLSDPDLGLVTQKVDPAGRTYWTQTANQAAAGTSTSITFDMLDRMTHRLEPDLDSYWVFDTSAHGVGQLAEAYTWLSGPSKKSYDRVQTYDSLSRPWTRTVTLDTAYKTTEGYDGYGRLLSEAYQRGTVTRTYTHAYNAMGMDGRLTNEAGTVLWQETAQDAFAREIAAVEGVMGLKVSYDPHTANRTSATWSVAASNQERYSETQNVYDVLNNLKQRTGRWNYNDPNPAIVQRSYQDAFTYDPMNRLWTAQAWSQPPETFTYDAIGNITSKTSVASGGLYTYPTSGAGSVGPHAVKSIAGLGAYAYDLNGNMRTAPNASSATWTSFDMPLVMSKAANSDTFVYGPEHQRISQIRAGGNTLYYEGKLEVEVGTSGATVKTYWPNGRGVTIDGPTSSQLLWTPTDKLGNVRGYLDASGAVVEMLDYDPWGKRRNPSGIGIPDSLSDAVDNKGFTGHEMLDSVGLVHMNGRIYDPFIGRFLSADPLVQSPEDSQSYNRYTYVWNNPTNLTDPTGFAANDCPKETVCDVMSHRDFTSAAPGAKITTTSFTLSNGAKVTITSISNSLSDTSVSEKRSVTGNGKGKIDLRAGLTWSERLLIDAPRAPDWLDQATAGFGSSNSFGLTDLQHATAQDTWAYYTGAALGAIPGFFTGSDEANALSKLGKLNPCKCFVAGTPVQTKNGPIPIEKLRVGDLVAARDEVTGETAFKPVLRLVRNGEKQVVRLTFVNAANTAESLGVTLEHPFMVEGNRWVAAGELKPGDRLMSLGGELLTVRSVVEYGVRHHTYNFEVADFHTYFVGTGGAWVHNSGLCDFTALAKDPGLGAFIKRLQAAGIEVLNINVNIMKSSGEAVGEIDVVTRNALIQYKNGVSSAQQVIKQMEERTLPYVTRTAVTFVNDVTKAGQRTVDYAARKGILVTNNFAELIGLIK